MIKRFSFVILVLLVVLVVPTICKAHGQESITMYGEYLTDSNGHDYGVRFFVESNVNEPIYVYAYIFSRNNVNGDVISDFALLRPNEKRVLIGSFTQKDLSKSWSVDVNAKWRHVD